MIWAHLQWAELKVNTFHNAFYIQERISGLISWCIKDVILFLCHEQEVLLTTTISAPVPMWVLLTLADNGG